MDPDIHYYGMKPAIHYYGLSPLHAGLSPVLLAVLAAALVAVSVAGGLHLRRTGT